MNSSNHNDFLVFLLEYYDDDCKPVKCPFCDSSDIESHCEVMVTESICGEYSYSCTLCNEELGYWAYGYFDETYPRRIYNGWKKTLTQGDNHVH